MAARKPRLSSDETKSRLIDAGIAALKESGMSIGMDSVNLEQAVRDAEVSRSSAYAVWTSDRFSPQEDFQRSVLLRAMEDRRETLDALGNLTAEILEQMHGVASPSQVLREIIRVAATQNIEATADSVSWKLVIALRAVLHSAKEGERDQELVDWMFETSEEIRTYAIENVHRPLAAAIGLKPRPQYGDRAFELGELCASAVSEGFSMRYWLDSRASLDGLHHHAELDGEPNWSMYALVYEQIVRMFFVPIEGDWD